VVVGNRLLYNDTQLEALDARTGARLWSAPVSSSGYAALSDGVLYTAALTDDELYAIDPSTGTILWTWFAYNLGNVHGSVVLAHGIAYSGTACGCGDVGGYVVAVDTATHLELWQVPLDGEVNATPAIAGRVLYAGTTAGTLYALDAKTGSTLWMASLGPVTGPPTVANGIVYASGLYCLVQAFDAATGTPYWYYGPAGGYAAKIAVGGGKVYFGTPTTLYELSPGTTVHASG
jgi:outer membrane protein assembly factor BamB